MSTKSFIAPTLEELAPLFPNYSIDAFIAQGGMGAVYLATQTSLERPVAIKILPREFGKDSEFRASFAAEAKAMAKLNHPNLIGVYDFGEVDGMPFIVMEYVAGKPLHDSAYGKQIDPTEAARIVLETCRGLHHAHEHNILHRDVKPANILMDPHHAEPKLGDFGLAMATSGEDDDGLIYGTPGYAAPEVYEGKPDARSDVYAAAVILYQLLTGQMPEVPYQHPSALSSCDRRFDTLLAKALQPEAHARFQTAAEFANELELIQKKPTAAAVAPGPALTSQPPVQLASARKGSGGAIIGVIAALIVIGAGVFFLNSDKKEDEQANEEPPDKNITLPEKDETDPPLVLKEKEIIKPQPRATREEPETRVVKIDGPLEKNEDMEEDLALNEPDETKAKAPEPPQKIRMEKPASTFDHSTFLKRGRDFCVANAKNSLIEQSKNLLKNIDKLEREGKSILRDEDYITRDSERARKESLARLMDKYRESGSLPPNLLEVTPKALSQLTWRNGIVEKAIRDALDSQHEVNEQLASDLKPLAEQYAKGVRKQAEQLRKEGNDYDANILEQEASEAEDNSPYFLQIVKASNPLSPGLRTATLDTNSNDGAVAENSRKTIVGDWFQEDGSKTILFSFRSDGTILQNHGQKSGKWSRLSRKNFRISWENGTVLKAKIKGNKNLLINNEQFKLKRVDWPIVGEWTRLRPEKGDVNYIFTKSGTFLVPSWGQTGTFHSTKTGFQMHWPATSAVVNLVLQENGNIRARNPGKPDEKDMIFVPAR